MALSDEAKLGLVRDAIVNKLWAFPDWGSFKLFLQGLTKVQIKTFILSTLQGTSDSDGIKSTELLTAQQDKLDLHTEVTNDI